jgi:hypothetical protein
MNLSLSVETSNGEVAMIVLHYHIRGTTIFLSFSFFLFFAFVEQLYFSAKLSFRRILKVESLNLNLRF